ncbi:uncharacterized protein RNJ42_02624 [Nakaseomyces bracarensis]|uniref:uncharacterized protein n=1 Tax=Nakaseomyces bracarensis TaxID=273131 RepID=UPI0038724280
MGALHNMAVCNDFPVLIGGNEVRYYILFPIDLIVVGCVGSGDGGRTVHATVACCVYVSDFISCEPIAYYFIFCHIIALIKFNCCW